MTLRASTAIRSLKDVIRLSINNRSIHCTAISSVGNSSSGKQVKILNKLMYGRDKGKRVWHTSSDPGLNQFSNVKAISNPMGVKKHISRRTTVLNKLFMKNITDLMATGEISEEVLGKGVQISRVKVAPDFLIVNVYWLAKGSEDDLELDSLLKKCSGRLRHELSQLRVMGEVPRINFVKDVEFAKYVEVERLLKGADFGLETIEHKELLENEIIQEEPVLVPEMRHDVLGLDHGAVLGRIQEKLKITKTAWQEFEARNDGTRSSTEKLDKEDRIDLLERKQQLELEREERFAQFLQRKKSNKGILEHRRFGREDSTIYNNHDEDDELALQEEPDFDEEFYKRDHNTQKPF